ncbi:MAG: ABC transporter permease [Atribacterota bacterium]|nr:ABC transporter permease [Atribacterota bacterium]MDD4895419.1 ABC transporter permease [Atribacterota bacterium]MDD5636273.1 ABC transporter permease [Atribacterota bacterium]
MNKEKIQKGNLFFSIVEKITPIIAIIGALIIGSIVILLMGEDPIQVYKMMFGLAIGNRDGWGNVLFRATPLIFTGLAVAFAFRCGLFNIGGEGQVYVGAFLAAYVGFTFTNFPAIILIPLTIAASAIGGAFWATIPGVLKAKKGIHEVIITIMMNWIAASFTFYLALVYKAPPTEAMRMAGVQQMIPHTSEIVEAARLPRIASILSKINIQFPAHNPLNVSFIIAIIAAFLVYYILWKTSLGYEIRAVGYNQTASEYAGINISKNIILAMMISGALAGLVGTNELMGYKFRWRQDLFTNLGFNGIAVALLGKNHPFGVVLAAILFGILSYGGALVNIFTAGKIPRELIMVIQAVIVILVVISDEIIKRVILRRKAE